MRWTTLLIIGASLALSACDKVSDGARAVHDTTQRTLYDTRDSWLDFFTYHPPKPNQAPQTRYCYQMQSDVVCYDSLQPQQTSRLVGYQDGDHISWVQPGGGALGVSGGDAISMQASPSGNRGINNGEVYTGPATAPTDQVSVRNLGSAR